MIIANESRMILIPLHPMISIACSMTEFSSIQSKIYNQTCEAIGEIGELSDNFNDRDCLKFSI